MSEGVSEEGGGALPRVFPITGKEDGLDGEVNVVLVGNMGVGKSTLGNFLYNMGDKSSYLFETSADPTTSCSKVAQVKAFGVDYVGKRVRMNLMDTPGLSELKPTEDLRHTIGLFEEATKMKEINMVILVAGIQNRFDRQTVDTMQYYRTFFQPVFDCGNVCLAIPNFSQRRMDELLESDSDGEDKEEEDDEAGEEDMELRLRHSLDKWRNECEAKLGIRLAACRYFESVTTNRVRKVEMKKFLANQPSFTVDRLSIESRNIFMMQLVHSRGVSLIGYTFPLPPVIEEMRKSRLERVQALLYQVTEKISMQNQLHSDKMEGLTSQSRDIVAHLLEISVLEEEIGQLAGVTRGGSVYRDGDDRFYFKRSLSFPLWADIRSYRLQAELWNCSVEEESCEDQDGKVLIRVRISPNFLNMRTKQIEAGQPRRRWYCKVWAEWDGRDANKHRIEVKRGILEKMKLEAQRMQDELERAQAALLAVNAEVGLFLDQQNALQRELVLVSKERYAMDEACYAISLLEKHVGERVTDVGYKEIEENFYSH